MSLVNKTKRALIGKANSMIFIAAIVGSVALSIATVSGKILIDQHRFNSRIMGEKRKARDNLQANVKILPQITNNLTALDQTANNSKVILEALPSKYDFPAVASSIEYIAKQSGQDMTKFKFIGTDLGATPPDRATAPAPSPIPFSATVTGSTENVFKFIADTERSIRPINFTLLSMKGTEGNSVTIETTGQTYYQPTKDLKITTKEIR